MKALLDDLIPAVVIAPRWRCLRHVLLQAVLIAVSMKVFWDTPDRLILTPQRMVSFLSMYGVLNLMVYVNVYLLTPRLLMKNRIYAYLVGVVALITLCLVLIGLLDGVLMTEEPGYEPSGQPGALNLISSFVSVGLLVAGTSAVMLFRGWAADNIRVGELESETLHSELALLRNQINPHFLFNMLNNSHLLIQKRRPEARGVLLRLGQLLRYQIEEGAAERVELLREIAFLADFLELEKVRRDNFYYDIRYEAIESGIFLPPMLFIPFVENAAKHNNDSENRSFIEVAFSTGGGKLLFTCVNSKPALAVASRDVGGIGLANVRRRLELLYPAKHRLEITDGRDIYTVKLEIEL